MMNQLKSRFFVRKNQLAAFGNLFSIFALIILFGLMSASETMAQKSLFGLNMSPGEIPTATIQEYEEGTQPKSNQILVDVVLNNGQPAFKVPVNKQTKNLKEFKVPADWLTTIENKKATLKAGIYKPIEITPNYVVFAFDQ